MRGWLRRRRGSGRPSPDDPGTPDVDVAPLERRPPWAEGTDVYHRVPYPLAAEHGLISMGEGSYGSPLVRGFTGDAGHVAIGRYCSIGPDVEFWLGGNHRTDWVTTYPLRIMWNLPGAFEDGQPTSKGPITVGNDVWIGDGAVVMSGVTIGDGAVIAARAVVTRDVRSYAVVAGNPAREVRRRVTQEQAESLRRIAWWDWPRERITDAVDLLSSDDVQGFIDRYADDG